MSSCLQVGASSSPLNINQIGILSNEKGLLAIYKNGSATSFLELDLETFSLRTSFSIGCGNPLNTGPCTTMSDAKISSGEDSKTYYAIYTEDGSRVALVKIIISRDDPDQIQAISHDYLSSISTAHQILLLE
ncbi:unnamed protein product [Moneuplotes crassus]|uniref:Uncharacterized protein n=1 Tax=Euplotes crassus TaxID=5936 RepID=A0AAD2D422_EUPCR|nr:unnamed protein product [Moneuplotes crassus]